MITSLIRIALKNNTKKKNIYIYNIKYNIYVYSIKIAITFNTNLLLLDNKLL